MSKTVIDGPSLAPKRVQKVLLFEFVSHVPADCVDWAVVLFVVGFDDEKRLDGVDSELTA